MYQSRRNISHFMPGQIMFMTDKHILISRPQSFVCTGPKPMAEEAIQVTEVYS